MFWIHRFLQDVHQTFSFCCRFSVLLLFLNGCHSFLFSRSFFFFLYSIGRLKESYYRAVTAAIAAAAAAAASPPPTPPIFGLF